MTRPDGKSFFGWYPRFYFQDPHVIMQSSGGMLQPQIGQALNGCWIYPYEAFYKVITDQIETFDPESGKSKQ